MPFQMPDQNAPLQQFLSLVGQQTNAAQSQQRNDAEVFEQAKRFQDQLREKKQAEAIQAALATLKQTGQANPQSASILKASPYGGMLDQSNKLIDSPDDVELRRQRTAEHLARLAQTQANTALIKDRQAGLQRSTQGAQQIDEIIDPGEDPKQWLVEAVSSGAVKPEQGLRMYLQYIQNQTMNQYRQSRPAPGAVSAGRQATRDSDQAALAGLLAELPGEFEQSFGRDPAAMAKAAVEHQKELGLSGVGLKTYVDAIFRHAKDQ